MKTCVRLSLAASLTLSCLACGGVYISGTQSAQRPIEKHRARMDRYYQTMHKHSALSDDYTSIISNPRIDRPVVVPQSGYEGCRPDVSSVLKSEGAQGLHKREFLTNQRNGIIRRLFACRIFRQILPHDDPADPAVPPDALTLEMTCQGSGPKGGGTQTFLNALVLRDTLANKSVVIKGTYETSGVSFIGGISRFYIDSVLVGSFNHHVFNALSEDYWDQIILWGDSCMDKMLEKMAAEYNR
jgi:hypothetical protein